MPKVYISGEPVSTMSSCDNVSKSGRYKIYLKESRRSVIVALIRRTDGKKMGGEDMMVIGKAVEKI